MQTLGKYARLTLLGFIALTIGLLLAGCSPMDATESAPPADRLTVEYSDTERSVRIVADSLNGVTCYVLYNAGISCLYTGIPEETTEEM